jgi:hypothetical protein
MKKIVSEDTVNAERRGGEHVPEAQVYIPNYREVNHLMAEAPGSASISFEQVLSKASMKMLEDQENIYKGIERDSLITDVNTKYQAETQKFLSENESGRGYTKFATETYSQLIKEAASNTVSGESRQQIEALGRVNLKGIANSAVQKENQLTTAYVVREKQKTLETKYNNILNDPDRFEGLSLEVSESLADLRGVIPGAEYKKLVWETGQNVFMNYGMGLTRKNPKQAPEFLKSEVFSGNLSHENYLKLLNYADQKKKDLERREHDLITEIQRQQNGDSKFEKENVEIAIELGTVDAADIESNDRLLPLDKQKCMKKYYTKNKERRLKENADARMDEIWADGGDISEVDEKYQKARYKDMIRGKQSQLDGEAGITGRQIYVTSVDKAVTATYFSYTNADLRNELQSKMIQTDNPEERVTAAIAYKYLMSSSPQTLGTVDQKFINFVNEVTERVAVDPNNKSKIAENAAKKYLWDKSPEENKRIEEKFKEFKSKNTDLKRFISTRGFDGSFFKPLTVEDKAQFEKDRDYEVRNALRNGASDTDNATEIAAARMKDYWKVYNGKYMRNPPQLMYPTLSEYGLKNFIAAGVKKAVSALSGADYPGAKFVLVNDIVKVPGRPADWYTKDLTLNKKPIVGIKTGDEIYRSEVELESIAVEEGAYKMYYVTDDGSRYYIPTPKNPQAVLRIGDK